MRSVSNRAAHEPTWKTTHTVWQTLERPGLKGHVAPAFGLFRQSSVIALVALLGTCLLSHDASAQAVFSESWENGIGRWAVSNGGWEIGPGDCHGGSAQCAATGLHSFYENSADTRLISPPIMLPTVGNGQSLVLRFWHWFNTYPQDKGVVEVSRDDGVTWDPVSREFFNNSRVWSQYVVNLTAYQNSTVRLAFHFTSDGGSTAAGWYIDDISIDVATPTLKNPEDFEAGTGYWNADNGGWEIGPGDCHGGSAQCAATGLQSAYENSADTRLISPPIMLPTVGNGQSLVLRFWHWFNTYPQDKGVVEVSRDGGVTWDPVSREFFGNSRVWSQYVVNLTAYQNSTVRLAFHFTSDGGNTAAGWHIDDISIDVATPTLKNPEDFEAGTGYWNADNGGWEIGPGDCHGGSAQCAATGLHSFYENSADTRLISPPIMLPTVGNGQSLVLRFWHWFNTYPQDKGVVEVSRDDGVTWDPVSREFFGNSRVWSQYVVNLTAYQNSTVRLAFHFTSDGGSTAAGWHIDDISIDVATPTLKNPEDFEAGTGYWNADNGGWEIGPGDCHGGSAQCAATGLQSAYENSADTRLISPPIMLPTVGNGQSLVLRFWHWFNTYPQDKGVVEVSRDDGVTWDPPVSREFFGNSLVWSPYETNVTAYQNSTVRLAFHFTSDGGSTAAGWYIDDIVLLSCLAGGECQPIETPPSCGDGVVQPPEQCDEAGKNGGTSCCSTICQFRPAGQTCRPSAGVCDVAETCSGSAGSCPANAFLPSSVLCRPSAGVCDVAEKCTGVAAPCPDDAFAPSTTICRAADGACDVAETCSGTSATCPSDSKRPAGFPCRPSAGACDVAEACDGTRTECPADAFAPSATICRPAVGDCDVADHCTGSSAACPADDAVKPVGTTCRAAAGTCDVAETCDGASKACPGDSFKPSSVQCRAAIDACDIPESCSGGSPTCPEDVCAAGCPTCGNACGNGIVDPGETCDNSATQNGCGQDAVCDDACQTCKPAPPCASLSIPTLPAFAGGRVRVPVDLDPSTLRRRSQLHRRVADGPGGRPGARTRELHARHLHRYGGGAPHVPARRRRVRGHRGHRRRGTRPIQAIPAGPVTELLLRIGPGTAGQTIAVCVDPQSVAFGDPQASTPARPRRPTGSHRRRLVPACQGDCNCDGRVNSGDRVCLISKFFDPTLRGSCGCEDCNLSGGQIEPNAADAPCVTLCAFGQCPPTGRDQ